MSDLLDEARAGEMTTRRAAPRSRARTVIAVARIARLATTGQSLILPSRV
jgi:hypothetical protein